MKPRFNPIDFQLCFEAPRRITGRTGWHHQAPFAFFVVESVKPRLIVELGTFDGTSFAAFCQAVEMARLEAKCHGVMLKSGEAAEEAEAELNGYLAAHYGHISRIHGSGQDEKAFAAIEDGSVDLLHIDDLEPSLATEETFGRWVPKLSPRGIVLIHGIQVRGARSGNRRLWRKLKEQFPHFELEQGDGLGVLAAGSDQPDALKPLWNASDREAEGIRRFFRELGARFDQTLLSARERERLVDEVRWVNDGMRGLEQRHQAAQANSRARVEDLQRTIEKLRAQLREIESSIGWTVVNRYREVRDRVVPGKARELFGRAVRPLLTHARK